MSGIIIDGKSCKKFFIEMDVFEDRKKEAAEGKKNVLLKAAEKTGIDKAVLNKSFSIWRKKREAEAKNSGKKGEDEVLSDVLSVVESVENSSAGFGANPLDD